MIIRASLLLAMLSPLFTLGCASPAKTSAMSVDQLFSGEIENPNLSRSITVEKVTGGKETNPFWVSQISNGNFKDSIAISLRRVGFESDSANSSKFLLNAEVEKVNQKFDGISMTVDSKISYELIDKKTEKVIWKKTFSSLGVATISDKFMAPARLQMANEASAKNNIIQMLSALKNFQK